MNTQDIEVWYNIKFDGNIIFAESYCGWSWGQILIIFEKDGNYYHQDDYDIWSPVMTTEEESLQYIMEVSGYWYP